MDNNKAQPVVRKVKKKQVKDELDRQKQAEKKKRRLEKALATSAAIISELEKKKQKKKEEQQRLDEEGAAIAEAVALHVLLGEEEDSSDEPCKIIEGFDTWDSPESIEVFDPWVSSGCYHPSNWNGLGSNEWSIRGIRGPYLDEAEEFSADIIAARVVSSLQIVEDGNEEDAIVLKGILRQ